MKQHILVVSQYFYPEEFRINDICKEWVKRGYKVTVVTGIPNYPQGKFYRGFGWFQKRREEYEGIQIVRLPIIPRGNNAVMLLLNYISFVISGFFWKIFTGIRADKVFIFEVSPMTQALVGVWYAKKRRIPCYIYVQDLWPENVISVTGLSHSAIIKPINKMVDYIYKNTDEIFATSPSFVDAICNRKVKVPREKVHYWPQYAEEFYSPVDKDIAKKEAELYGIPNDDSFKIIFTGNIGTAQGLDILPKTADLLKSENIKFVMVGDGRYLEEFINNLKKRNVRDMFIMLPRQPAERIPMLLSACDVAFLSFADDDLWKMTIPAKLQSYMACGMPIIAIAEGETQRIVEEAECGVVCRTGAPEILKQSIIDMMQLDLEEMQKRSLNYYEENYKKEKLMNEMIGYWD